VRNKHIKLVLPKFFFLITVLTAAVVFSAYVTVSLLSSRTLQRQEAQAISTFHEKLSRYLNDRIRDTGDSAFIHIARDITISGLRGLDTDIDKLTSLYRNIQYLTEANPYIDSVYYYSGESDQVFFYSVGAVGLMAQSDFFDTPLYAEFLQRDTYEYLTGERVIQPNYHHHAALPKDRKTVVSICKKIPLRGDSQDVLVLNLATPYFHSMLNSSNIPPHSVFLTTDTAGQSAITYYETEPMETFEESDIEALYQTAFADGTPRNGFTYKVRGVDYYVSTSLERGDRLYYLLVPVSYITASSTQMNTTFILVELVILAIGVILALFLSQTITKPLSHMMEKLRGNHAAHAKKPLISYALFTEMDEKIDDIVVRTKESETVLNHYFHFYKESMFLSILNGSLPADALPDKLFETIGNHTSHIIVIASVYAADCAFAKPVLAQVNATMAESANLAGSSHLEILSFSASRTVFVLSFSDEAARPNMPETLEAALSGILRAREPGGTIVFVIEPPCPRIAELPAAFRHALGVLGTDTYQADTVILAVGTSPAPDAYVSAIHKTQDRILAALSNCDMTATLSEIDDMHDIMVREGFSLRRMRKQYLFLLYNMSLGSYGFNESVFSETIFDTIEGMQEPAQFRDWLHGVIHKLLPEAPDEATPINNELIEKVKLYINEHYHEDISLSVIAEYVFFTPQYLGKLFKEVTGGTFTNYLIKIRMEAASQLLLLTKQPILSIAEKVGYGNVQSFGRVFKGYYHCTPGEYRKRTGAKDLNA